MSQSTPNYEQAPQQGPAELLRGRLGVLKSGITWLNDVVPILTEEPSIASVTSLDAYRTQQAELQGPQSAPQTQVEAADATVISLNAQPDLHTLSAAATAYAMPSQEIKDVTKAA